MWQHPWQYRESIAVVSGIVVVGLLLQMVIGNFPIHLLQAPANIFLVALILIFAAGAYLGRKRPLFRWLTGVPLSVTLIGTLVALGIIMGLTPQVAAASGGEGDLFTTLGFTRMTTSWPFVLVYFMTLLSLGALIVRKLIPFRLKDYAFHLNHIGLWLLLLASGLGAADMRRYVMYIREGETEWRVYSADNDVLELPVAITLNDFYMEEYPPQLVIVDRNTGMIQPEEEAAYLPIDMKKPAGVISKWEVTLDEYIHEAVRNSDSTYREVRMPASSPAAKVTVRNQENNNVVSGWVCVGNSSQLFMLLDLDQTYCVAMTRPEPKRFVSDIDVMTEDGGKGHALLEVNKPYKAGHWMLYQYGYDNEAGKLSTYSAIELVYDPWLWPVYIGIFMIAAGSICMLWIGNKRKGERHDVE